MAKVSPDPTPNQSTFRFGLLTNSTRSTHDGCYAFDQIPILISTEAIRRQLRRTKRAIRKFNVVKRPWQGVYIHMWLTEYLLPLLHVDELMKKNVLVPYFVALGEEIPVERLHYERDSEYLSNLLEDIVELSYFVCSSCLLPDRQSVMQKLQASQENLKVLLENLELCLTAQYSAEEEYWPKVFRKYGPNEVTAMQARKVQYAKTLGDMGHTYMATILFSLGNMTGETVDDELDTPWCGPKMSLDIVKIYPFFIKFLPPSVLFQPYLTYRRVIEIVRKEECKDDLLGLMPYYQNLLSQGKLSGIEKCFNRSKRNWNLFPSKLRCILNSFLSSKNVDQNSCVSSKSDPQHFPWISRTSSSQTIMTSSRSSLQ